MYIENTIEAANSIQSKWVTGNFQNNRAQFTAGNDSYKATLNAQIISLYENLNLYERRFLIKIKAYETLVEAYDAARSTAGITRNDITILTKRLAHLGSFTKAANQLGIRKLNSIAENETPSIEVSFPIESKKSNVLNAVDTIKRFFNVLNQKKEILGKTESDLTLELLENRRIKITFGTSLEYSLVIVEIWSSLTSQGRTLKRINENIENLRNEGISETALEAVLNEGTEIVKKALDNAKVNLTELEQNDGEEWETSFNQLGKYLEGCLTDGYKIKLILPPKLSSSYQNKSRGALGERALKLAEYSRDIDDANIAGSKKLLT